MKKENNFLSIFHVNKPLIGMLHLKGTSHEDSFDRFKRELDIYIENGMDCVIVEDYFGTYIDMVNALEYIAKQDLPIPYGVNCLNMDQMGFTLAEKYDADFVQLDSVVGHIKPRDEDSLAAFFKQKKDEYSGYILGGVRFKYQPVLSAHSESYDLKVAEERADAICVTGVATGSETPIKKVQRFRKTLGDFPLIVGAGLTPNNLAEEFDYADGAIVGSYLKEGHDAENEVSAENVKHIVLTVKQYREEKSL